MLYEKAFLKVFCCKFKKLNLDNLSKRRMH